MMFKCHCRDCQQTTGGAFAPGMLVPAEAFRLTRGQLRYHFTPSQAGGNTNAVFARNAVRESPEVNSKEANRRLSDSWLAPSMIPVGSSRRWIFLFQTRNHGTKWIPRFRNSNSIRRQRKNREPDFTNRHELIGIDSTVFRGAR